MAAMEAPPLASSFFFLNMRSFVQGVFARVSRIPGARIELTFILGFIITQYYREENVDKRISLYKLNGNELFGKVR